VLATPAGAQDRYPSATRKAGFAAACRVVRVDLIARALAIGSPSSMGQPFIVENMPGANGSLAAAMSRARHQMATR
jgi:tripartite-type tricarboxylate transporter receptor subunit TctC